MRISTELLLCMCSCATVILSLIKIGQTVPELMTHTSLHTSTDFFRLHQNCNTTKSVKFKNNLFLKYLFQVQQYRYMYLSSH